MAKKPKNWKLYGLDMKGEWYAKNQRRSTMAAKKKAGKKAAKAGKKWSKTKAGQSLKPGKGRGPGGAHGAFGG